MGQFGSLNTLLLTETIFTGETEQLSLATKINQRSASESSTAKVKSRGTELHTIQEILSCWATISSSHNI